MQIREQYRITVTDLNGAASVQFARDPHLIASLKARFAKARWGRGTASWHIPGKLAYARATIWAAEQDAYLRSLETRARDAEWDAPAPPPKPRRITWRAIPGQAPNHPTTPQPPGDIDRITAEIARHNDAATFWGVLGRPDAGLWRVWPAGWDTRWGPSQAPWIQTYQDSLSGRMMTVEWQWAALWGGDGWTRDGWLPSVHTPALWPIINPGVKMPWA